MVDKFGRSAHKRVQNISAVGASLSYINDNFIRNNGSSQMTGTLNMGNNKISNVHDPVDNQDVVTKHYLDSHLNEDLRNSDIDMNRYRVKNLRLEPQAPSDAVAKYYVDTEVAKMKPVISIIAAERGPLVSNAYEWSFGHGISNSEGGYVMTSPGRLLRLGLKSVGAGNNFVMVALTVNGNTFDNYYNVVQLQNETSGTRVFEEPQLSFSPGDVINFVTRTSVPDVQASYITALIELDL